MVQNHWEWTHVYLLGSGEHELTINTSIDYRVTWIKLKYVEGCIGALDSSQTLKIIGTIFDILLIKEDDPYFVCEVMTTEECSDHLLQLPSYFTNTKNWQIITPMGLHKL